MISRWKPGFDIKEIKYILTSGVECVEKFEKAFAKLLDRKYALSFHNGRSGFYSLIKCLNINKKEIIIPSFNCTAIPFIIQATDNIPKFCRISLTDYNNDIDDMLSRCTKKTKIVMPTYMYGYPVDVKKLKDLLDENIFIIEDAALALFTKGAGRFGDAAFYSFGLYKPLYTFSGGIVTTDNDELYEKLMAFRQTNLRKCNKSYNLGKIIRLLCYYPIYNSELYQFYNIWHTYLRRHYYAVDYDSYDYAMSCLFLSYSQIEAKIGLSQLKKARGIVNNRIRIAEWYNKALQHLYKKINLPPLINGFLMQDILFAYKIEIFLKITC